MTKKEIEILAQDSYINNKLDEKKVLDFSGYMDRKTLKKYIDALLTIEKKRSVIIATADQKSYNTHKELFQKIFTDKQIITEEDPSLLLGLRITDNDMIYEKSLSSSLANMVTEIERNYE